MRADLPQTTSFLLRKTVKQKKDQSIRRSAPRQLSPWFPKMHVPKQSEGAHGRRPKSDATA